MVMASHTKSLNVLGSNTQEVPCVHYTPSFKSGMKVGETLRTPSPKGMYQGLDGPVRRFHVDPIPFIPTRLIQTTQTPDGV